MSQHPEWAEELGPMDALESRLRARLQERGRPAGEHVDALEEFARALPAQEGGRHFAGTTSRPLALRRWPRSIGLAAALTVVAVAAVCLTPLFLASTTEITPGPSATPTAGSPAASPSASPPTTASPYIPDPSRWASDPRLGSCRGHNDPRAVIETIYEFTARDYHNRLPMIGYHPTLERDDSVLLVIYAGESPLDVVLAYVGAPTTHTPEPGTKDLCVADLHWHERILSVALDWYFVSGRAYPETTPGPTVREVATVPSDKSALNMGLTNLVWDPAREALWYADVGCGEPSALYRVDPETGRTQQWKIPSDIFGTARCLLSLVAIDETGIVWIREGTYIVRFDPATNHYKSVRIAPWNPYTDVGTTRTRVLDAAPIAALTSIPPGLPWALEGLAVDGSSALVANGDKLIRVDSTMHVTRTKWDRSLDDSVDQMVVAGGCLFFRTATSDGQSGLRVFTVGGRAVATSTLQGYQLSVRPDGSVVLWQSGGLGVVVDAAGTAVGTASVPLAVPYGWSGLNFTTDWNGRTWYFVQADGPRREKIVEVTAP
jgi:hypothetical protein